MLSKEEVQHIAKLARLELTEEEIQKMQKDLSSILEYFNILKKAPKPAKHAEISEVLPENATRKDEVILRRKTLAGDLVMQAPAQQDGYVKVKQIL